MVSRFSIEIWIFFFLDQLICSSLPSIAFKACSNLLFFVGSMSLVFLFLTDGVTSVLVFDVQLDKLRFLSVEVSVPLVLIEPISVTSSQYSSSKLSLCNMQS